MTEKKRHLCPYCKQKLDSNTFGDVTAVICHWCENRIKLESIN